MNFIYEGRIDIVIGIEYVNFFENQYKTNFFIDLYIYISIYRKHITDIIPSYHLYNYLIMSI